MADLQPILLDVTHTLQDVSKTLRFVGSLVSQFGATSDIHANAATACEHRLASADKTLGAASSAVTEAFNTLNPWTIFDANGVEIPAGSRPTETKPVQKAKAASTAEEPADSDAA